MTQQLRSPKENAFEDRWLTVTNVPMRINALEFVIPFPPGKAQKTVWKQRHNQVSEPRPPTP